MIEQFLKHEGWELVQRTEWTAVRDHRPEFKAAFPRSRVGKIVDTRFYVTLPLLAEVTKELIKQLGCAPVPLKSTSGASDAVYWGFNTESVSDESLKAFVKRLAAAIDEAI